jgi:hypothetical protein
MGQLEELRDYKSDGTPTKRYWMEPLDRWWDFGFYFHCLILIGVWMLYSVFTTGYLTKVQFMLNHTITVFWVFCAGIYSASAIVVDILAALRDIKKEE